MKILLIATYLPPYIGSGNIRLLNYINYLSRFGNDIDVIGVDYPKDAIAYDETLENSFDDNIRIYRIYPGFIYNKFNRKRVTKQSVQKKNKVELINKLKLKINKFIKVNLLIPDSFVFWIKPAYKKGCELIRKNKYDLILSIHETPSSHIVAYKLKKRFRVRWIGYWSDPWCGDSALRCEGIFLKTKIESLLEKKVVNSMDKLLFTTKGTMKEYTKKYSLDNDKTDIVYRGYDPELYDKIKNDNEVCEHIEKGKINIVHTGTIYSKLRDIEPLSKALNKLKNNKNEIYNKLNILFIGQFTDIKDEKLLERIDCVKIIPLIPFNEALRYIIHSDALLLYGNKDSTQVPGKVYEYIGSDSTIITILGSEKDELNDLMKDVKRGPIIQNTENEIYFVLSQIDKIISEDNITNATCDNFKWNQVVLDLEKKIEGL